MNPFKGNIGRSNNRPTGSTSSLLHREWIISDSGRTPADEPVQVPGQPFPVNYRRFKGSNMPAGILSTLFAHHFDSWGLAIVIGALPLVLHNAVTSRTLLLLIAIGLLYWLGYAINDYFDAPLDAQDERKAEKNFFVYSEIPGKLAAFVLLAIGGFVSYAFVQFGLKGIGLLALAVFVMWGYSAPPLRFKSRPGLDLLIHAIFVFMFPYLVSLFLIDAVWSRLDYLLLGISFFISLAGQLRNQIRDCEIDSRTDLNFTTTFGVATSIFCLRVTTAVTVVVGFSALAAGIIPVTLVPLAAMSLPVALDRLMVGPGKHPPSAFNLLVMGALAYLTFLLWAS